MLGAGDALVGRARPAAPAASATALEAVLARRCPARRRRPPRRARRRALPRRRARRRRRRRRAARADRPRPAAPARGAGRAWPPSGARCRTCPAVACFDTAFHATLPAAAATYALPAAWRERFGLRRFGFHGLSHALRLAPARRGRPRVGELPSRRRRVAGAVRDGVCVDTTMGFTPMEGLVMATRAGSVDPGLVLWLLRHGLDADALERAARSRGRRARPGRRRRHARRARARRRRRPAGDRRLPPPPARRRSRRWRRRSAGSTRSSSPAAWASTRPRSARGRRPGLGFLGVELDAEANAAATADAEIGAPGAPVRTLVVTAREDLEVARGVRGVLARSPQP